MKPSTTIKLKAIFLLVSFSLNSVVGFACSLGLDMGFNSPHHHHEGEESHQHKHGGHNQRHGNHDHGGVARKHKHDHQHKHGEGKKHHEGNTVVLSALSDYNCCNDYVVGFQNLDKQLAQKFYPAKQNIEYTPLFFPPTIIIHHPVYTEPVRTPPKILDHSPPPDIRVIIQSFQI